MKGVTVSLPDEMVEQIKAAAGEGRVSAYVAGALADYQEQTSRDEVLAAWQQETPVPEDMRHQGWSKAKSAPASRVSPESSGVAEWSAPARGAPAATSALVAVQLMVGSSSGTLFAFDPATGTVDWAQPSAGPVPGSPARRASSSLSPRAGR
jgi:outer membrane protein assembly factor BamB